MNSMYRAFVLAMLLFVLTIGMNGEAVKANTMEQKKESGDWPSFLSSGKDYEVSNLASARSGDEEYDVDDFTANGIWYTFSTTLQTRGQKNLPAFDAERELNSSEYQEILQDMRENYPYVEIIGRATSAYNCHSYAWYNASTSNTYWIVDVSIYINDVHTYNLQEGDTYLLGDIVVYYNDNGKPVHSAIITELNGTNPQCTSKWGAGVLCIHGIEDVPEEYQKSTGPDYEVYRIRPHSNIVSYNSTTHTYSCSDCPYSITEPHILSPLGTCRICGYSGPVTAASVSAYEE